MKSSAAVTPHPAAADHQAKPSPVSNDGAGKAGRPWERWTHRLKVCSIGNVGAVQIRGAYWPPGDVKALPPEAHDDAVAMGLECLGPAE